MDRLAAINPGTNETRMLKRETRKLFAYKKNANMKGYHNAIRSSCPGVNRFKCIKCHNMTTNP